MLCRLIVLKVITFSINNYNPGNVDYKIELLVSISTVPSCKLSGSSALRLILYKVDTVINVLLLLVALLIFVLFTHTYTWLCNTRARVYVYRETRDGRMLTTRRTMSFIASTLTNAKFLPPILRRRSVLRRSSAASRIYATSSEPPVVYNSTSRVPNQSVFM